jgi:integrase
MRNTGGDCHPERSEPALVGLRDRALIAVMMNGFARVKAVLEMKVRDYVAGPARLGTRPRESRQGARSPPLLPQSGNYLDEYIATTGIANGHNEPLFRMATRQDRRTHA